MKELIEKVAVITGASEGIGKAIAHELAAQGCRVILIARNKGKLDAAVRELTQKRAQAFAVSCDVGDAPKFRRALQQIEKKHGAIDILVNNAGVGTFKPMDRMTFEELTMPTALPIQSSLVACYTVLPGMRARGRGHIVNLTSPAGYFALPNMLSYATARHAIVGLSLSLSEELRNTGIGVSLICPGQVRTGYFTRNDADVNWFPRISKTFPIIEPEDVAVRVRKAIVGNQREVIFPFLVWFFVRFYQTFPRLTYASMRPFGLLKPSRT